MSIFLEKGPARTRSKWNLWKMHWVPLRLSRKPALRPLCWLCWFQQAYLLETDESKQVLGAVLSQKEMGGWYHPVVRAIQSLTLHECNYHSTKQEFLALKWVIAEQFQECLLWKLFIDKTDNNPLICITTTPNLDATQHHWVESLERFTFSIEYRKCGTMQPQMPWADLHQSWMGKLWSPSWTVTMGTIGRAEAPDPAVAEADEEIHRQVWKTAVQAKATQMHVNLHVTDWVSTQQEDPILATVIEWISMQKVRIWSICWETTWTLGRERLSFKSRKGWPSTKELSTIAKHQLASWKKFWGS